MRLLMCMILASITFVGCKEKAQVTASESKDPEAAKKEVSDLLDRYHQSLKSKNVQAFVALLTEDGLYCGTDPGELWDKKTFSDYLTKVFSDPAMGNMEYAIDTREVRVSDDGNSAIVIEQFQMKELSTRVRARLITHTIKDGQDWKIDFSSLAMVPANADLGKIDKALESTK